MDYSRVPRFSEWQYSDQSWNLESTCFTTHQKCLGSVHYTQKHTKLKVQPLPSSVALHICRVRRWVWNNYQVMLFAYRTAIHTPTGVSPLMLMFGRHPYHFWGFPQSHFFDPGTYQTQIKGRFAELDNLVYWSQAEAKQTTHSKGLILCNSTLLSGWRSLWLSVPTVGKLQPTSTTCTVDS